MVIDRTRTKRASSPIERSYWLTVWCLETWRDFVRAGAKVYGLPERYEQAGKKIKVGDFLICYMSGRSEFFAVLEVTSESFWDNRMIWLKGVYPVRFQVRRVIEPRRGIKFLDLFKRLTLYTRLKNPTNHRCWSNHFHQSLRKWEESDAKIVIDSLTEGP